jgi:hypothetical protein
LEGFDFQTAVGMKKATGSDKYRIGRRNKICTLAEPEKKSV